MKIGITGSSGILGSNLRKILNNENFLSFSGKIENYSDVYKWVKKNQFDSIIHLAAIVPTGDVNKNKKYSLKVNVNGTKNLINAINLHSKKKVWFFYASTSHVYKFKTSKIKETDIATPVSYYGKTKIMAENYVKKKENYITPCIGRIFSFTDKKQNKSFIIPKIFGELKSKKKKIYAKNLNHIRDFLQINDVAFAIKMMLKNNSKGIYNICSGKGINLIDLMIKLNKKYKKKIIFIKNKDKTILVGVNKKLINLGWRPNETNYIEYLLDFINEK